MIRALVVTSEWPTKDRPASGIFIARQVELLRRAGVDVTVFAFSGGFSPIAYWNALHNLRKLVRERPFDVLHAHWGHCGLLACLQRRVPVVVTFHGSDIFGIPDGGLRTRIRSRLLQNASRLAARWADRVITVSPELASKVAYRRPWVIPIGIDRAIFHPAAQDVARQALSWDACERVVLFVGSTKNPAKRSRLAAEAVQLAARRMPDVRLRICDGETPQRVPLYMNAADVLVVTSTHEGGPLVIREALACTLPVVSLDVGDARKRVGSLAGCVVCSDQRAETLAEGLLQVLEGRRRIDGSTAIADLDENRLTEQILEVYRDMMGSGANVEVAPAQTVARG